MPHEGAFPHNIVVGLLFRLTPCPAHGQGVISHRDRHPLLRVPVCGDRESLSGYARNVNLVVSLGSFTSLAGRPRCGGSHTAYVDGSSPCAGLAGARTAQRCPLWLWFLGEAGRGMRMKGVVRACAPHLARVSVSSTCPFQVAWRGGKPEQERGATCGPPVAFGDLPRQPLGLRLPCGNLPPCGAPFMGPAAYGHRAGLLVRQRRLPFRNLIRMRMRLRRRAPYPGGHGLVLEISCHRLWCLAAGGGRSPCAAALRTTGPRD